MKNLAKPLIALLMALLAVLGARSAEAEPKAVPVEPVPVSADPSPSPAPTPSPQVPVPEDEPEEPRYTLRVAASALPENWGPFGSEEGISAILRNCLSAGLYEETYDESAVPRLLPVMAAGAPEDVTSLFASRLGVSSEETRRAWRIRLRPGLCWQDSSPLTAQDFVDSAMRLLDPEVQASEAALFTEGTLALTGARDYWSQKLPVLTENARRGNYSLSDLTLNGDGVYCTPEGYSVYIALDWPLETLLYGERLRFYVELYGDKCFDLSPWEDLAAQMDRDGLVPLTPENYSMLSTLTMGNPAWGDTEATLPLYFVYACPPPPVRWSDVGIMAEDDASLILLLENPADAEEVSRALTQRWLVKPELYDACASREDGRYRNSYGSSLETSPSYGPYLLKEWLPGVRCVLERDPAYFEWAADDGSYQTTGIEATLVPDDAEALELLEQGLLDACLVSGRAETPEGCQSRSIPGGAVLLLALNPDLDALVLRQAEAGEQVNKTILTIPEFRQAIRLSLDREALCREVFPAQQPALGLISPLVLSGAEGPPYRSTAQGQAVLAALWGEAANDAGYAPEAAGSLFARAWALALEAGLLTEEERVELTVGVPVSGTNTAQRSFELLDRQLSQALRDTPLEGKLSLVLADDMGNDPLAALRRNQVDLLLGVGWAADPASPAELMEAYLEDAYRCDPSWDLSEERLSFPWNGRTYTASLPEAYSLLRGGEIGVTGPEGEERLLSLRASKDPALETELLAALEGALLQRADLIPLSEGCVTLLTRDRLLLPTEEYHWSLGFGGLRSLRYACSDREWAERN